MNRRLVLFLVVTGLLCGTIIAENEKVGYPYFFELTIKTNGGNLRPDVCMYIGQYLAQIGIKVNIMVVEWTSFVGILMETRDFDLAYVALADSRDDPDPSKVYSETSRMNFFGINKSLLL